MGSKAPFLFLRSVGVSVSGLHRRGVICIDGMERDGANGMGFVCSS
jgi:hypothetical protein